MVYLGHPLTFFQKKKNLIIKKMEYYVESELSKIIQE